MEGRCCAAPRGLLYRVDLTVLSKQSFEYTQVTVVSVSKIKQLDPILPLLLCSALFSCCQGQLTARVLGRLEQVRRIYAL